MGLDIFAIKLEGNEKGQIVRLIGDLNEKSAQKFFTFMDDFLDNQKPDAVILDCQDIKKCTTKAYSAIFKLYQNMRVLKKGLILARVSKPMAIVMSENFSNGKIPCYEELDRAIEIATYFLSKRSNYDKRKLESLRETPAAMIRDDKSESIFKNITLGNDSIKKASSATIKRPRTGETVKRYTTEDFTAWFKPEQSRRIRKQGIDVLLLQNPDSELGTAVLEIIDDICTSYRLKYNKLFPLENRLLWEQALEIVNNARAVIIDFSVQPEFDDDFVSILTFSAITRLQKTEDQIILINSTEEMPVLWRDLPVIYYDGEPPNLDKLKGKLDAKLLPLSKQ